MPYSGALFRMFAQVIRVKLPERFDAVLNHIFQKFRTNLFKTTLGVDNFLCPAIVPIIFHITFVLINLWSQENQSNRA